MQFSLHHRQHFRLTVRTIINTNFGVTKISPSLPTSIAYLPVAEDELWTGQPWRLLANLGSKLETFDDGKDSGNSEGAGAFLHVAVKHPSMAPPQHGVHLTCKQDMTLSACTVYYFLRTAGVQRHHTVYYNLFIFNIFGKVKAHHHSPFSFGVWRGWVVNTTPRPISPWKWPGTHCIGGLVGPGPVWTGVENLAPPGFGPQTVQPVASHCADYAIPAHHHIWYGSYVIHTHTNPLLLHQPLLQQLRLSLDILSSSSPVSSIHFG